MRKIICILLLFAMFMPLVAIAESAASDTNEYYHEETGIHFAIPDGWREDDLSKDRKILKMKMSPITNDITNISYGSQDVWQIMALTYSISTREESNAFVDGEFLKEMFGSEMEGFTVREYAGIPWGIGTMKQDSALGVELEALCAVTVRNGYYIQFMMFDLSGKDQYTNDFYTILESVYFD